MLFRAQNRQPEGNRSKRKNLLVENDKWLSRYKAQCESVAKSKYKICTTERRALQSTAANY